MRQKYEKILGEELRYVAIQTRERLGLTQREMSERLQMSESSYSDIETGRSFCGALTETLLLSMMDNPNVFVNRVTQKFSDCIQKEIEKVV